MADILLKALQMRNKEKRVYTITQYIDIISEVVPTCSEVAIITTKEKSERSTYGYKCIINDILDCKTQESIFDLLKEKLNEKGFEYDKMFINTYLYNKMKDKHDAVMFADLIPVHIKDEKKEGHYYQIKVTNVPRK